MKILSFFLVSVYFVGSAEASGFQRDDIPHEFKGRFVNKDDHGIIHIHQPNYPKYKVLQSLIPPYREIGAPIEERSPGGIVRCRLQVEFYPDGERPLLVPMPTEAVLNEQPFSIINERGSLNTAPYFSCGRLKMFFPTLPTDLQTYAGTAAAIDKNLLITAAHNFLPEHILGRKNEERIQADSVLFEHLLTTQLEEPFKRGSHSVHVASHCYIHPEWKNGFDPQHDIALVFLSECMDLTDEERSKLLQLQILPDSVRETVKVIGYPGGHPFMRESVGSLQNGLNISKIIYHSSNTLPGNSGSSIVIEGKNVVGIHTRAPSPGQTYNRGVRIREDLLPFIEESVRLNQLFLEDEEKALSEKEKMHEKLEEEKLKRIREEERLKAQKEAQRKLEEERLKAQKEAQRKLEEERLKDQKEAQRKLEEERLKDQKEAQRKLEEERLKDQKEAQRKLEEERLKDQKEAQRKLEEERLKRIEKMIMAKLSPDVILSIDDKSSPEEIERIRNSIRKRAREKP